MTAIRAVLVAVMILALAATPFVVPMFGRVGPTDATAHASGTSVLGVFADDDDDDLSNDHDNDNEHQNNDEDDDSDDGDNDNAVCYRNLNSNEAVPCDFDDDDDDRQRGRHHGGRRASESRVGTTKCFDVQEVGVIQMGDMNYDVTVAVVPSSGFPSVTRLSLRRIDPGSVPAPPGGASVVSRVVFALDAQNGCNGAAIVPLGAEVNLGIVYKGSADKSKLQIVRLEGGSWTNVTTVPDPGANNPYVSATIASGGTYALIQRP